MNVGSYNTGYVTLFKTTRGHHGWCKLCGGLIQRDKHTLEKNPNGIGVYFCGLPFHLDCLFEIIKDLKTSEFNLRCDNDSNYYKIDTGYMRCSEK